MSIRNAVIFTVLFAILTPYYLYADRPQLKPNTQLQEEQESLLKLTDINSIEVTRGGETVKFQKAVDGKRYELVEPQGKFVPQDLMQAVASLLLSAKQVEVVANNTSDLTQFGLDHPTAVMTINSPDRPQPIQISFGTNNPTDTAVYATIAGVPKVFLLGRNLEYYYSLMFQWIEGKQGKNA